MSVDEERASPGQTLPTWDLTALYPSVDGPEVVDAEKQLAQSLADLAGLYDSRDVRHPDGPAEGDSVDGAVVDEVLDATNAVLEELRRLMAFAHAHVSGDSTAAPAQALLSRLRTLRADLAVLETRLDAWAGWAGPEALVTVSETAQGHAWPLQKAARRAAHQMSEAEEALAARLKVTGSAAWSQLYNDVTAGLTATVAYRDGREESLPIFAVRGLATNPDPAVREAAFKAELAAWEDHAAPIAGALNAIKGETLTVGQRRGWDDPLDEALEANAVDRPTLDALNAAVDVALDDFERYLAAKARLLGKERCAFWDLYAPVGTTRDWTWDQAVDAVEGAFAGYSPELAGLARHALADDWIDAGPRAGKVGGAFCMPIGDGESRLLMNFDGSFDAVHTLAHELGHAYHNRTLGDRTALQRITPMPLAETASIFCEAILTDQALAHATDEDERLMVLEVDLQAACKIVVDIRSRFLFETELFERRRTSTVAADDLCEIMDKAQADAYGAGLDPAARHHYMWAAKPHYYGSTFYNWPYTFGLLFGLGLYGRWRDDPAGFRRRYDDLLASTGLAPATELASRFGIDLHDQAFWASSLDVIRSRIDDFSAVPSS